MNEISDISHYSSVSELLDNEPGAADAVREYYIAKRADYLERVGKIEDLLGFMRGEGDLGTRLHNLERFTGVKVG